MTGTLKKVTYDTVRPTKISSVTYDTTVGDHVERVMQHQSDCMGVLDEMTVMVENREYETNYYIKCKPGQS